jgi:rod shape-determining protein MreD
MSMSEHRGGGVIVVSFVAALMLTIVPLPNTASLLRPEWVALVLIYWCLALPTRVGVGVGWISGLVLDVARGTLLGQHALALSLVAFIALSLHQRVRVFPLWQQAVIVLLLVVLQQLLVVWVRGITGHAPDLWLYLLPAVTSMVIWPWLFILLRYTRRHFQVK